MLHCVERSYKYSVMCKVLTVFSYTALAAGPVCQRKLSTGNASPKSHTREQRTVR